MKKTTLIFILTIILCIPTLNAQNLNVQDLVSILNKKSWSDVDAFLSNKGFTFHTSDKTDAHNQTITWSYDKNWSDAASAWFYLSVYDNKPIKVMYTVSNDKSYKSMTRSLGNSSFTKYDQLAEDKSITTFYKNSKYYLSIEQEQRDRLYGDGTQTVYNIILFQKGGKADSQNGKKEEIDIDGNTIEYTLQDGKINGQVVVKDVSGKKIKQYTFVNGNREGDFYELLNDSSYLVGKYLNNELNGKIKCCYKSNENIIYELSMKDGDRHGECIFYYPSGKIKEKAFYSEGEYDGTRTEWNEDGNLIMELNYQKGLPFGLQRFYYYPSDTIVLIHETDLDLDKMYAKHTRTCIENGVSRIYGFSTYKGGKLNGSYFDCSSDIIVFCHYKDSILDGEYLLTIDTAAMHLNKIPNCDTTGSGLLVAHGYYCNGIKCGKWEFGGQTLRMGEYRNGRKNGEWKTYISKNYGILPITQEDVKQLNNLQLSQTTTYKDGLKNGPQTTFMYYDSIQNSFKNQKSVLNYSEGILDGQVYYFNEDMSRKMEGKYQNGKKIGEWVWYEDDGSLWIETYSRPGIISSRSYKYNEFPVMDWNYNELFGTIISFTSYIPYRIEITNINNETCNITQYKEDSVIYTTNVIHHVSSFDSNATDVIGFRDRIVQNELDVRNGNYELKDTSGRMLIKGILYNNNHMGQWTYYYYDQKIKLFITFKDNVPYTEYYETLDGQPFSGKFEIIDKANNIKEIRKIKKGVRDGKTIQYDLTTNKVIKKISYDDGFIDD